MQSTQLAASLKPPILPIQSPMLSEMSFVLSSRRAAGTQTHCKVLQGTTTDKSNKDTEELDDIGVGDCIETAGESVKDGDQRRDDHRDVHVQLQDHREGSS